MRLSRLAFAAILVLLLQPGAVAGGNAAKGAGASEYVVLYAEGASLQAVHRAISAAHGQIVKENTDVGVATVTSSNVRFMSDVRAHSAIAGAARNRVIGSDERDVRASKEAVEKLTAAERKIAGSGADAPTPATTAGAEPLASLQWDMAMMHATPEGSYGVQTGNHGVRVAILDTGVDGTHPDIAPNFDAALSRNFTTDMPSIDGACEFAGCVDPANHDDNGHGTHVAGTIGAAINGLGIAGVAPDVTLVNLRAGQDSGFFFLQPSIDALTYAANNGIDVVNMSYYIDPWLFNCADNPADSPEEQLEQRTVVAATNRALEYAHKHGVTLIGSEGNEHTNLDNPTFDGTSPDYPPGTAHNRNIDNSCLVIPTEGMHVISVGSVGPSTRKADYSNWGLEQTEVTAPGGWFRDGFGTPTYRTNENLILSTYPANIAMAAGQLNPDGSPNTATVVRDCQAGTCAYYQYLQGTSMASPHAVGVAALIVSQWGHPDGGKGSGQMKMSPKDVEKVLTATATDHACPDPALITYTQEGRDASFNALCTGTAEFNSIWGNGIVDALHAVTSKK